MDSYNSKYPLEYYSIGTPYMFYVAQSTIKNGNAATVDQVKKYGEILMRSSQQTYPNSSEAKSKSSITNRCIGVVVDKYASKGSASIEVMFLGCLDGKQIFLNKKYIVAHSGVFCDDKENVAVQKSLNLSEEIDIDFSKQTGKNGGITVDTSRKVNGGITLDAGNHRVGGGITIDK